MDKIKKSVNNQQDGDLFLKKHVGLIHSENRLSLLQRKISNILLFNALSKIHDQDVFEISINQLCNLIGYHSNDTNLIKKAVKSLISVVMEWNLLEDNKFISSEGLKEEEIIWNASALLAGATIRRGHLSYSYSPQIKSILTSLEIYGRINLFVQAKFASTYSLVLYENCVRFRSIKQTTWFPLKLLRSLLGIDKALYPNFKEFNRKVLNVAVKEINKKSDIFVEPQYKKEGRRVVALKFNVDENENYQPSFKSKSSLSVKNSRNIAHPAIYEVLSQEFGLTEIKVQELIKAYSNNYINEKIELVREKKQIVNKAAYLIVALKEDYKLIPTNPAPKESQIENNYMREYKSAAENTYLRNQYMHYKAAKYQQELKKLDSVERNKILSAFEKSLEENLNILKMYKRKGADSPFTMSAFVDFIEKELPELKTKCLAFDAFLVEDLDTIEA